MTLSSLSKWTASQPDFDADKVRQLIAEYLGIDAERVMAEAHFSEDLGLDWLDRIELMILIEDEFAGVEISEDDANQIEVVGDLIRHVETLNKTEEGYGKRSSCGAGAVFRRSAA